VTVALIENGLSFAVFGAVALSILMSIAFLLTRGGGDNAHDRIGEGGISREGDYGGGAPAPPVDTPAACVEREREIRQMLNARSERLVRSGKPALDVDAELARLLDASSEPSASAHDATLVVEVRQLVIARNERRIRQGQEPLDVESEVTRTLEELEQ
jgi:hypothetical protein